MTKISHSKQILSEIELLLNAGKYEDAKVLLSFLDDHRLDRESRLHVLLINVTLDGAIPYKDEIDDLRRLSDFSDLEKEIISKILFLVSKSVEEGPRDQGRADPVNRMPEQPVPLRAFESQLPDKAKLLQDRESELLGLKKQLAELSASKEEVVRLLEETVMQNEELLRTKEAALNALENRFSETIGSLENQLSEKEKILESREANLKALAYRVNQLNTQLVELDRAKDEDARLFREEIAQKSELLRLRDSAIKKLEERFAQQIRVLECQLGDEQNLLEIRDRELNSLMAKVKELTQERADLASERETSDRLLQEALREKAALRHANESSTRAVEEMRAKIQWLERELAEKQELVENSGTAVAELRRQIHVLTKRSREVAAAKLRAETLLHEERIRASQVHSAGDSTHKRFANEPPGDQVPAPEPTSTLSTDCNSSGPSRFRRAWQITWKRKTFRATALPVAAVGLLMIAIAYFLLGHGRAPTDSNSVAAVDAVITKSSIDDEEWGTPVSPSSRSSDLKSRKTADADYRNARRREDPPGHVIAYKTRRAVSLREEPRFAATARAQIGPGTPITVLEAKGDWFKVKTQPSGAVGYVRKEYLVRQPFDLIVQRARN
jgi:Bacterial SH3 domain